MSLEGSGPAIGRPPRRREMESNHHPAFFKRVREPSLLPRQNWLRDQELHLATPAYEAGSTLGLPALGLRSHPFQAVRPVSRAYKAHPLARADGRSGAGNRERSGDLLLGKQALSTYSTGGRVKICQKFVRVFCRPRKAKSPMTDQAASRPITLRPPRHSGGSAIRGLLTAKLLSQAGNHWQGRMIALFRQCCARPDSFRPIGPRH